jgi:hypothetical protein
VGRIVNRLVALAFALVALGWPALGLACPVCAQREDGSALGTVSLAVFIVAPWIAALAIGLWIRRGVLAEQAPQIVAETNE